MLFTFATLSLDDSQRDAVLIVAVAGAVVICEVTIGVLVHLIDGSLVACKRP